MNTSVEARLLKREVGYFPRTSSIWGVYGDKTWINDLDIVNELGGHSGCVNALRYAAITTVYKVFEDV